MQDYNFWADLLSKFYSSSDFVKTIWIISFTIIIVTMMLGVRNAARWISDRRNKDNSNKRIEMDDF